MEYTIYVLVSPSGLEYQFLAHEINGPDFNETKKMLEAAGEPVKIYEVSLKEVSREEYIP